ncbi:MAG: hypothetical protein ACK5KO_11645 [Arachnia sp.]
MRRQSSWWRDCLGLVWLAAALVVALAHQAVPEATWLMVHLVGLGALTHAIVVWTRHFAHALLRVRPDEAEQLRYRIRVAGHTLGAAGVLVCVPFGWWPGVVGFAAVVAAVVIWHGAELWRDLRRSLPGRFRVTLVYYLAAAGFLPVGATFGVMLATGPGALWFPRLLTTHIATMLLGWILLTVFGTLLTLWPTMLRVRMDDRAERFTQQACAWLVAGVALVDIGALVDDAVSVGIGLGTYLIGVVWWGRGLIVPLRRRLPREFAPASVGVALVWLAVALGWAGWGLVSGALAGSPVLGRLLGVGVVGFGVQLLTGALSYLLPSVHGGGPSVVRAYQAELNRWATARLTVINSGLLIWLLPVPGWVRITVSSAVLVALALFLPLVFRGARAARAQARHRAAGQRPAAVSGEGTQPVWTRRGFVAGAGIVAVSAAAGIAVDPRAAGLPGWPRPRPEVAATGQTTEVDVVAKDMRFTPDRVEVPRGNLLLVHLRNDDVLDAHDLRIGDAATPRISPGGTADLETGPIAESIEGYCTVPGHRQMGMTLDVVVM